MFDCAEKPRRVTTCSFGHCYSDPLPFPSPRPRPHHNHSLLSLILKTKNFIRIELSEAYFHQLIKHDQIIQPQQLNVQAQAETSLHVYTKTANYPQTRVCKTTGAQAKITHNF